MITECARMNYLLGISSVLLTGVMLYNHLITLHYFEPFTFSRPLFR